MINTYEKGVFAELRMIAVSKKEDTTICDKDIVNYSATSNRA